MSLTDLSADAVTQRSLENALKFIRSGKSETRSLEILQQLRNLIFACISEKEKERRRALEEATTRRETIIAKV